MPTKRCSLFIAILFAVLTAVSATAQTPAYQTFPAPSGFATNAGEPSIGVDWNTGAVMYQAVLETDQVTFSNTSPATASWKKVNGTTTSVVTLDPILFTDHTTGRTFVSELAGVCSLSAFSDNNGASYTPSIGCGVPAGI